MDDRSGKPGTAPTQETPRLLHSDSGGNIQHSTPSRASRSVFFVRHHNAPTEPHVGYGPIGTGGHAPRFPYRGELAMVMIPQQYFCPCCADVLRLPLTLSCGHEVCQECFDRGRMKLNPGAPVVCPISGCSKPIQANPTLNMVTKAAVGQMPIRCINGISYDVIAMKYKRLKMNLQGVVPLPADDYCREPLSFDTLEAHFRTCPYSLKPCQNQVRGCEAIVLARDQTNHEAECTWQRFTCPMCGEEINRGHQAVHMENSCPKAERPCTHERFGCTFKGPRSSLNNHAGGCPFGEPNVNAALEILFTEVAKMKGMLKSEQGNVLKLRQQLAECQQQFQQR